MWTFDGSMEDFRALRLKGNQIDRGAFVVLLIFSSGARELRSSIEPNRQLRKWTGSPEKSVKRLFAAGEFRSSERVCREALPTLEALAAAKDDLVVEQMRQLLASSRYLLAWSKDPADGTA
ncbi:MULTISPECIES: hypothetical protein [Acidovorax]|uniref:CRISPR type III-B/RAMP module-associated protein Cmr5 n=1 Tax=Acidovorax facilis TaxID=12917 RepID=A0ABV8DAM0_9BURK|nr:MULTISPECIES: hypothetical protein [Acidovorax]KQB58909.1 hypothetical protein AE621_13200 [Acidovorax sp. SD340]MBO1010789.1 hypothetical protein [Acidovorax sp. SD340]MCO4244787.1 hypothetical protein [Acidovorax facilis]